MRSMLGSLLLGSSVLSLSLAGCTAGSSAGSPTSTGSSSSPSAGSSQVVATPTSNGSDSDTAAFIRSCGLSNNPGNPARPDLIGLTLAEVEKRETVKGNKVRLVGEDGTCEAMTDDLRRDRVNVYLEDGHVVWAEVF